MAPDDRWRRDHACQGGRAAVAQCRSQHCRCVRAAGHCPLNGDERAGRRGRPTRLGDAQWNGQPVQRSAEDGSERHRRGWPTQRARKGLRNAQHDGRQGDRGSSRPRVRHDGALEPQRRVRYPDVGDRGGRGLPTARGISLRRYGLRRGGDRHRGERGVFGAHAHGQAAISSGRGAASDRGTSHLGDHRGDVGGRHDVEGAVAPRARRRVVMERRERNRADGRRGGRCGQHADRCVAYARPPGRRPLGIAFRRRGRDGAGGAHAARSAKAARGDGDRRARRSSLQRLRPMLGAESGHAA